MATIWKTRAELKRAGIARATTTTTDYEPDQSQVTTESPVVMLAYAF